MKNIGYVLADFPVFSETFVGDEMRAMMNHGHSVTPIVMHLRSGSAQEDDRALARTAITLGHAGADDVIEAALRAVRPGAALSYVRAQTTLSARSLLWNALKIASVARARGCGHLHAHFAGGAAAHAIVAARLAGISASFVCHGHDVYAEAEDLELKLRSADFAVAVCNDLAEDLKSAEPAARIAMVPCGVDPDALRPAHAFETNGRLLFVGRLVEQKGLDDLMAALAMQGSATIDIVGDGPLMQACQDRCREFGLSRRVSLLGARPREWIRKAAPGYFGLVAPFKTAPDGARDTGPLVVKEAMAMGLPVVASRFMGLKETVSPETGFLTEPGDPASLAQGIAAMLALSQEARESMGRKARARVVESFSLRAQARSLSGLMETA